MGKHFYLLYVWLRPSHTSLPLRISGKRPYNAYSRGHCIFWRIYLKSHGMTTSYDSQESVGATNLAYVVVRLACEWQSIQASIVWYRNFVIEVAPYYVMMDSGAQLMMISKRFFQHLQLMADNFSSCPFSIVTSIGHMEWATSKPLQFSFRMRPRDPPTPLLLVCAETNVFNYESMHSTPLVLV